MNTNSHTPNDHWQGLVNACALTALLAPLGAAGQVADAGASASATAADPLERILNPGPFRLRPHAGLTAYYDSNPLLSESDTKRDFIWALSPGLLVGTRQYEEPSASYAVLDYLATVFLFTDHTDYNGLNHSVNLAGHWTGARLTLDLSQGYYASHEGLLGATNRVDREFAGRMVDQETFPTWARAHYQFSDKTSAELGAMQQIRDFESELNSYNQWDLLPWINYQLTAKLQTSLGGTFGWRDIRHGPNQTYQQGLARLSYQVATKVTAVGQIGAEWDQYQGGADDGPFVVFRVGARYQPQENTVLTLDAHRQQYPSVAAGGQNYFITGFMAGLEQRFHAKWIGRLTGGYDHSEYRSRLSGTGLDREDDYFYISPALDYRITEHWDAGLFYVFRENVSNADRADYSGHQVGLRTAYRF